MRRTTQRLALVIVFCSIAGAWTTTASVAVGDIISISLTPVADNTLFRYDPDDPKAGLYSNGSGDFFSAGVTFSRSQIQRGLIRFDLSDVPAGGSVVPGSVELQLYVVDSPGKDKTPRPFWLVPLGATNDMWGEGSSFAKAGVSGQGSGAPAEPGDATWFHTRYDPTLHDPKEEFHAGARGYWDAPGALGDEALDPWTLYGDPHGVADVAGTYLTLTSDALTNDLMGWLDDPASNFGWIVLGDETIDSKEASTKRAFASREHAQLEFRPRLTFEYRVVPEPATGVLFALAVAALAIARRRAR